MLKSKLIFILVIPILVFLAIFLVPFSTTNSDVAKGDLIMDEIFKANDKYGGVLAIKFYDKALKDWPILKINLDFQRKLTKAKMDIEKYKRELPAVEAFLKEGYSESEVEKLKIELQSIRNVIQVKHISSEDAYNEYREKNKGDPILLESITPNFLPASLKVYMDDWDNAHEVANFIKGRAYVNDVVFHTPPEKMSN